MAGVLAFEDNQLLRGGQMGLNASSLLSSVNVFVHHVAHQIRQDITTFCLVNRLPHHGLSPSCNLLHPYQSPTTQYESFLTTCR